MTFRKADVGLDHGYFKSDEDALDRVDMPNGNSYLVPLGVSTMGRTDTETDRHFAGETIYRIVRMSPDKNEALVTDVTDPKVIKSVVWRLDEALLGMHE